MLRLKAPAFWHKPSPLGTLLAPLGNLYGRISALMQSQTVPFRPTIPVFCVGNVTLGGAGKTPTTLALVDLLLALGETPHILSRGYGANLASPVRVDPARDTAATVGDEPLLLAHKAPTWANPSRANSARLAMNDGATVLLLDDGLQHGGIVRDTSFLVIDTDYGLGNGKILPAGPLRETLDAALQKSHAIVALGEAPLTLPVQHALPVFRARLHPSDTWQTLRGQPVFAFSGLANNDKFFRMCKAQGMHLIDAVGFPDHHRYTRDELKTLFQRAAELGARVVTTQKDAVKLHPEDRDCLTVLPIATLWENPAALRQFITDRLTTFRQAPPTLSF